MSNAAPEEIGRLRALLSRALHSMEEVVHWAESGEGRPPQQTCLLEILDIRAALMPPPQVLDAVACGANFESWWEKHMPDDTQENAWKEWSAARSRAYP